VVSLPQRISRTRVLLSNARLEVHFLGGLLPERLFFQLVPQDSWQSAQVVQLPPDHVHKALARETRDGPQADHGEVVGAAGLAGSGGGEVVMVFEGEKVPYKEKGGEHVGLWLG
jgi:hypothetical protein